MRWPWKRPAARPRWNPPAPVPDGDQVVPPGDRRSADVLREVMAEPTRPLPVARPLMTRGAQWRARQGRDTTWT